MNVAPDHTTNWNFIDAILVINLDDRLHRWDQFLESVREHLPTDKLRRISAVYGRNLPAFGTPPWFNGRSTDVRWAARAGCTLSHRSIMELAATNDWKTVLILEDDADFSAINFQELDEILAYLRTNTNHWDVCYLGYSKSIGPSHCFENIGERSICRVSGCATTHAYLVNTEARNWILKKLPTESDIWPWIAKHRAIDRWYARHLSQKLRVIAVSPALIPQIAGYSDIVQKEVNYDLEFPGIVTNISRSATTFHTARVGWRANIIISSFYDLIRYLIKKSKGF